MDSSKATEGFQVNFDISSFNIGRLKVSQPIKLWVRPSVYYCACTSHSMLPMFALGSLWPYWPQSAIVMPFFLSQVVLI